MCVAVNSRRTSHLTVNSRRILSVTTRSNDLDIVRDAEKWIWNERRARVDRVWFGFFDGGETG
jgi:hypothetical protein